MRTRGILLAAMVGVMAVVFSGFGGTSSEESTPKATVVVDGNPDSIDCPWQLSGPDGYSHDGQGTKLFRTGLPATTR